MPCLFWSNLGPGRSSRSNSALPNQVTALSEQFQVNQDDVQQIVQHPPVYSFIQQIYNSNTHLVSQQQLLHGILDDRQQHKIGILDNSPPPEHFTATFQSCLTIQLST